MNANEPRDAFTDSARDDLEPDQGFPYYPDEDEDHSRNVKLGKGSWIPGLLSIGGFILLGLLLVGLLLPATRRVRVASERLQSQNSLKQIGIAMNNFAADHNGKLPNVSVKNAPYFFCGQVGGEPSEGPGFLNGILSYMESNTKTLAALDDPNLGSVPRDACSYSIPAYWTELEGGTGDVLLPKSFRRGTSQCIAAAEMTTFGVNYKAITPFSDDPYTPAVVGQASDTANNFSKSGCQVVMVDGSVRNVSHAANTAVDWTVACHPDDVTSTYSPEW